MPAKEGAGVWTVERLDPEQVQAPEQLPQDALDHVRTSRTRERTSARKISLPTFWVGVYAMVVRVQKCGGELPKLVSRWMGPWRGGAS